MRIDTGARSAGRLAILSLAGGALVFAAAPAWASPDDASHNKVTICHATGSQSNPYVVITPDAAGVANGHYEHQDVRDIIPPFEYNGQSYEGHNYDTQGEAVWKNGCQPVEQQPTPPPGGNPGGDTGQPCPEQNQPGSNENGGTQNGGTQNGGTQNGGTQPVSQPQPQAVVVPAPVAATAPVTTTKPSPVVTSAPIPTAVEAGRHTTDQWQLPVGASLLALGAAGTAVTALRRRAVEH